MLVDTHAHIQMPQFSRDRAEVIAAAFARDVGQLVVPGIDVATSRAAITLARLHPGRIFAAVGTHPHDAETLTGEALETQRTLAREAGVVAIGEIGLDFYRNLSPREQQFAAIEAQLALARERELPVILHNRDSHAEMITTLRAHGNGVRGVFHCFIGDQRMARDALDLGFYLTFAGPLTYPRNDELRAVAAWAPADRILVETDSPYLAPQGYRGKRNEPARVALVAEVLATTRKASLEDIARTTTENAQALFGLPTLAPATGA